MVNPLGTRLRNALTRLVVRLPKIGRFVRQGDFIPKPTYKIGSYFGLARRRWRGAEGRLMPQPNLRGPDGRRQRLDDLAGTGFVLIGAGVDPRDTLDAESKALWAALGARFIAIHAFGGRPAGAVERAVPAGLIECEDPDGTFHQWLHDSGAASGHVAIVRPDKFVFALVRGRELPAATREFHRQMHRDEVAAAAALRPAVPATLSLKEAA
jgi:3-(3-hydroxy-phenyl)propionate hydroxylase